ncbi:hypothetical protein PENTCL1PPCAC_5725 [Pristionchus entomophagus]|uniref:Uncharacterized protein n=1 Tax=Pristionchus entomophagus TaxID=358040 RepID=A0AAV5SU09_9BILA|nr:hypothetical protein PENTCL1PPCAC_5725 [Pristionchus entomophagus]
MNLIVDELCSVYPSLRPSTEKELIAFKKEFVEFREDILLNENLLDNLLDEVLQGLPSRYLIVPVKIQELSKIIEKEFHELSEEDRMLANDSLGYLYHKIHIHLPLKMYHQRESIGRLRYGTRGTTMKKEEILN